MEQQEIALKMQQLRKSAGRLNTGIQPLDELTGGLIKGGVTVVGARPAMGRTSLVLNMVERISAVQEGTVMIFSPRHSNHEITMRLMNISTGLSTTQMMDGSLPKEQTAAACAGFFQNRKGKVQIVSKMYPLLDDIWWHSCRVPDLRLILVDNPEYVNIPHLGEEAPRAVMDETLRTLKNLAQELNVPVICTVHLDRKLELRANKRPRLSDLKKIGIAVDLPDQAIFLYRHSYYSIEAEEHLAQCLVAKNKQGATGIVDLNWQPDTGIFQPI